MDKKKIIRLVAGKVVKVLDVSLRTEANTASCIAMYQPKSPESLSRFKRK